MGLLSAALWAQSKPEQNWQSLGTLRNARFVYVTSYDGPQFSSNLLPEDRAAIARVQDGVEGWGGYIVVYRPQQADMILVVQSRPSEDVLAVYSPGMWPNGSYLWRSYRQNGFSMENSVLLNTLNADLDRARAAR